MPYKFTYGKTFRPRNRAIGSTHVHAVILCQHTVVALYHRQKMADAQGSFPIIGYTNPGGDLAKVYYATDRIDSGKKMFKV